MTSPAGDSQSPVEAAVEKSKDLAHEAAEGSSERTPWIAFTGVSIVVGGLVAVVLALANFIGLPLMFLSAMLIDRDLMPAWMRTASLFNPVEWAVSSAREPVLSSPDWGSIGLFLALLTAFAAATAGLATWAFRAYQRTL